MLFVFLTRIHTCVIHVVEPSTVPMHNMYVLADGKLTLTA